VAVSIDLELTNRCNASCYFCPRDRTPHQGLMSVEVFEAALARAVDYRDLLKRVIDKEPMISLCGLGEPLLNKHAASFVQAVKDAGFRCALSSNGALLDERRGDALLEAGLDEILINAGEQGEAYEDVYKLPWEKTRDNIIAFAAKAEGRCDVEIILVNHRRDDAHQDEMRSYWSDHGVRLFHEFEVMNRGGSLFVDHMQYQDLPELGQAMELLGVGDQAPVCVAPFFYLFVGYDGVYYLCCSDWEKTVPLGTVFDVAMIDLVGEKLRHVSCRTELCRTCNLDPVNSITDDLRAVSAGELDRTAVDVKISTMRVESKLILDGLEVVVPGLASNRGKQPGGRRRSIPVQAS
jgi:MoaA/NifB/PqqE/SkfB family radical SAM enzyme